MVLSERSPYFEGPRCTNESKDPRVTPCPDDGSIIEVPVLIEIQERVGMAFLECIVRSHLPSSPRFLSLLNVIWTFIHAQHTWLQPFVNLRYRRLSQLPRLETLGLYPSVWGAAGMCCR